ncbi:MAG: hypothetical protein ACRDL3_11410 [Solirubrobacterales bacterium]
MATQGAHAATNERIVRMLEEVKARLAECKKRDRRIADDLARLLKRS